jgi:hypothetical protein
MLENILYVAGKSGLFKLVSKGKSIVIIESLVNKRRMPIYMKERVLSLGKITVHARENEVPLHEILTHIQNKEGGEKVKIDLSTAKPDDLRAYLAEILPDFDREKVYPSDIRKILSWYNLLISSGITNFTPEAKPGEASPEEEK